MKKTRFLWSIALSIVLLISFTAPIIAFTGNSATVYRMYVNGEEVGIVKFAARALSLYDRVEKRLREEHDSEVFIDYNVHFKEAKMGEKEITDDKALEKAIKEAIDVKIKACAIKIDGEKICYLKSTQDAQNMVEDIKAPYIQKINENKDSQLEEITLKQDLSFEEELISENMVISNQDAMEMIVKGNEGFKEHEVKEGDTLWSIARANGIEVSELQAANPDIDNDIIHPGDIIKIGHQERLLTVVTKEKTQYTKKIPYETEVREDNNLPKGKTKVLQQGEEGKKEIVALVTKEDGQEVNRDIVEEKVVKEPIKHIEAKGTKVTGNTTNNARKSSSSTSKSSSTPTPTNRGSAKGSDVANYAMKFLGYPYVKNGKGPKGFDCSGFTSYVYKQFGVNITSWSVGQRSVGTRVEKSDLRPGDIVCFKNGNHVGIYIGNGNFIHASTYKTGVKISNLKDGKYPQRYVTARRIFN
jgi:cell wall-associated NlpC family hydrolase